VRATQKSIINFLKEIKADLKNSGIVKIALFGSFARDEAGVYSDIDIAIKKEHNYLQEKSAYDYFEKVASLREQLQARFHRKIDIFDLDSDSIMKKMIMKDLIYV